TGPSGFTSNEQYPFIAPASVANIGKYYVNVTSDKGCTSIDSATAALYIKPIIDAGSDATICEGQSVQLNSTGSNNITSYSWVPASSLSNASVADPVASPTTTTEYILTAANNDCKTSDSVWVTVNQNPTADAGPDKIIIKGQSTVLNGRAGGTNVSYEWKPDSYINAASVLTPIVAPVASQIYTLNVISNVGCGIATDSVLVKVYQQLYIPNAFTPNGDGVNDTWYIETLLAYPGAEVKVYNRAGQVVFDNHGKAVWWDGTYKGLQQTSGAYVYVIDLKNNMPLIKGVVYIIL
ncbi:MAG TPA: gliding motility-associated C-terminal domain-containing protein, partial [Chitinophagaceae bacterium]|nr:gliding motility-associated C-terminal domain-containing protein [Chitinophagaceae bacterium]